MKPIHYILYIWAAVCLASCDSGDIQDKVYQVDEKGYTVKMTACVSGLSEWEGTGFSLAVAGFTQDSKFALVQKAVPSTLDDGTSVSLVLSNISSEVRTVEVALTNSLRERIITLASVSMEDYSENTAHDTIRIDLGTIDVGRFGVLQTGLFDRACIQCHGGTGRSAAGLNLTKGNAYAALVDVPSTRLDGYMRVESGNAEGSLLHLVLNEGGENLLSHNHTEILSSQFKSNLEEVSSLIDSWIEHLVP
ncbi:MAG: hypothetical protein IJ219_05245 [Bacteroidaceae bacterium]|nr:hypothetical protein [Bacteroidaceae bacterium]